MRFLAIVALCIGSAVVYGVVHDQVTARVCVEYFTIGHPRIIQSQSPTALAFAWGFAATWWVGFFLGVPLAVFCRVGAWPKLEPRDLVRPISVLLASMGLVALFAGLLGYRLGIPGPDRDLWARVIPPGKLAGFSADAWAHSASYLAGAVGGIALWNWALIRRWRLARVAPAAAEP